MRSFLVALAACPDLGEISSTTYENEVVSGNVLNHA